MLLSCVVVVVVVVGGFRSRQQLLHSQLEEQKLTSVSRRPSLIWETKVNRKLGHKKLLSYLDLNMFTVTANEILPGSLHCTLIGRGGHALNWPRPLAPHWSEPSPTELQLDEQSVNQISSNSNQEQ